MYDNRFYNIIDRPLEILELARLIECDVSPIKDIVFITNVTTLEHAKKGDVTFLHNNKYLPYFKTTKASACIVDNNFHNEENKNIILLRSKNPYFSYTKAINLFYSAKKKYHPKIMDSAIISEKAKIGKNCYIGHNVVIEDLAVIGDDSVIESGTFIDTNVVIGKRAKISSNVSISYSIIGDDVIILAGAKIGNDGFGFSTQAGRHHKIFHNGRVIVGNDVEIGANTTIDRGSLNDTIIEDFSRIDNLVQIGHNVKIGKGSVVAGMTGIAGSTEIGMYCAIGGNVGIAGHLKIGNQAQIAGGSGVMHNIEDKQIMGGRPAVPIKQWHRQTIIMKKLLEKKVPSV